jgi:alpha-galactosidase
VLDCIQLNDTLRQYAGVGHWNDPDMLEVGNGMSENEDRAHFTMWCMMASPLILGNDVRSMSAATKAILTNRDIIAIDQDALGVQGWHVYTEQGLQFWLKPLAKGDWAFTILNPTKQPITYALNWQHFNVTDKEVSGKSTNLDSVIYKVKNLWTGKMEGKTSKKDQVDRKLTIPSHDVLTYRLIK